jgi:hypothetical protein
LRIQIGDRLAEAQRNLPLCLVDTQLAGCDGFFVTHEDCALGQGQILPKKGMNMMSGLPADQKIRSAGATLGPSYCA